MAGIKERLDKILAERGLCESRAQAQALIMGGKVRVKGQVVTKPGTMLVVDAADIAIEAPPPYVSRGGLKLEKALAVFDIPVAERVAIDVGAATGGFTDCLLQRGAEQVIAVDVGHGQLDWRLRQDARVQVLEKTNIRLLKPEQLSASPSLGVVDTSFISLKKVLPPLAALLSRDATADIMALLKPQFEYRDYVSDGDFKGVVRGEEKHQRIVEGVLGDLSRLLPDWHLLGLDFSPITGPKGNIEFLLHYRRRAMPEPAPPESLPQADFSESVRRIVAKSYEKNAFSEDFGASD